MKKIILLSFILFTLFGCKENASNSSGSAKEVESNFISNSGVTLDVSTGKEKDLGNGFLLEKNEDKADLKYNGSVVLKFDFTPSDKVPFIWDEACSKLFNRFEDFKNNNIDAYKQKAWESFTEIEKKKCISESLKINVEKYDERFYKIYHSYYEGYDIWLYDSKNIKLQQFGTGGLGNDIKSIVLGSGTIDVIAGYSYGDESDRIIKFDDKLSNILNIIDIN